jgi:glycosyltransferase involved in cell wall biosynthesis
VRGSGPPLNLLFLTQTYPRFEGDTAGPFIRDLARGLARRGDRVTVLAPHAPGLPDAWEDGDDAAGGPGGVEVRTFRYAPERAEVVGYGRSLEADEKVRGASRLAAPLYALGAHAALRRELWRRRYDLVHAHWIVPNGPIAAAAVAGAPLAIGLHGSDVFLAEKRLVRPLVRWTLARAALLTGCSPELVGRVRALAPGYAAGRSRVIPYGVDVRGYSPDPERRGIWRRRLGIPEAAPLLLGVGRMATKKGFQVLIEALPRLLAELPTLHVVLAGAGDLLPAFERAAAPWRAQVHFPGAVLRDTLPDLYRAADVFVLPAVHDRKGNVDGLPNVILEAMASGLPVVSTPVSGVPLAVVEGETGRLAREGDAESLFRALVELLSDPGKARAFGAAGRRRAVSDLTWDAVAGSYREGYLAALDPIAAPLSVRG